MEEGKVTMIETLALAGQVKPVLEKVDKVLDEVDLGVLDRSIEGMVEMQSYVAAWPMEQTIAKAEELKDKLEVFEALRTLFTVRREQRANLIESLNSPPVGETVLRDMGLV